MEKAKEILNTYYLNLLELEKTITNKDEDFLQLIELTSKLIVDLREQNIYNSFIKQFESSPRFLSEQVSICTHPVIRERLLKTHVEAFKSMATNEIKINLFFKKNK